MTTQGPTQQHTPYPEQPPGQQSGQNFTEPPEAFGHGRLKGHGGHGWMLMMPGNHRHH